MRKHKREWGLPLWGIEDFKGVGYDLRDTLHEVKGKDLRVLSLPIGAILSGYRAQPNSPYIYRHLTHVDLYRYTDADDGFYVEFVGPDGHGGVVWEWNENAKT